MIKVNGIEFEFNSLDADCVEKAENSITKVKKTVEQLSKGPTLSASAEIRKVCKIVSDCFDEIFGEGSGNKVLNGTSDMGKALEAFAQLSVGIRTSQEQSISNIKAKYIPNRDARRHSKK